MVLRSGRVGATVLTTRSRRPARSTSLGIEKAITEHRWGRWESNLLQFTLFRMIQ